MSGKKIFLIAVILIFCTIGGTAYTAYTVYKSQNKDFASIVETMVEAYKEGNYEEFKKYIGEDNDLNYLMAGVASDNNEGMAGVYKAVHDKTKNVVVTTENVEGEETWGTVKVTVTTVNVRTPVFEAMLNALENQIVNGGNDFANLPEWLKEGVNAASQEMTKEFTVHVGCSEGPKVLHTNTNREFFEFLSGNYYQYIDYTMTSCETEGDVYTLLASGDEIIAMAETALAPYDSDITKENAVEIAQAYSETYSNIEGIAVCAKPKEDGMEVRLGVAFDLASGDKLYELGIVDGSFSKGGMSYLSLSSTVESFEMSGLETKQNDFGSGVLDEK